MPAHVAESICRKYLSRNRHEIAAWDTLIACVERNGSASEAVRLADQLLKEQPGSVEAATVAAGVYCNNLLLDQAWDLLADHAEKLGPKSAVRFGELCLIKDPARAGVVFDRVLRSHPNMLGASLGAKNAAALSRGNGAGKVAFYLFYDWHRSIQQSIFDACVGRSMPCFMTNRLWLVRALAPDVLVVSDTLGDVMPTLRYQLPGVPIVHTRHGFADKNYAFYAASAVDFVCVSSESVAADYVETGVFDRSRFWVTGYPQVDSLFAKIKANGVRAPGRTVLFAPTFRRKSVPASLSAQTR